MISFRSLVVVLVLGASSALPQQVQWLTADDATYRFPLPAGWRKMGPATLEYGLFFGAQGESFVVGMDQVFMNPAMLNSQLPGYSTILSHSQLVLKSRMLASPMGPREVVTTLLPQLAGGPGGAIQNLHVLHTFSAPEDFGFRQMLVLYEYTLVPHRDVDFASQAHPDVRSRAQTPMQAAAYIVTFPYTPGQFSWQFGYRILSAPQNIFQRNARTYAQIFRAFQVLPAGLRAKIKSNEDMQKLCDSMNQTTYQMAESWGSGLGAEGAEATGGGAQPPPSPGGQPAKGDSCVPPLGLSCGGENVRVCCHQNGNPDRYWCVPKRPYLVLPPYPAYNCRPAP